MKRKYFSALLMGALTIASVSTFTSCKDYDDDISGLQSQIDQLKKTIDEINSQITAGSILTDVTPNDNGITVKLSNGKTYDITNGKDGKAGSVVKIVDGVWYIDDVSTGLNAKGDKGDKGDPGTPGTNGTAGTPGAAGKDGAYYLPKEDGYFYKVDGNTETKTGIMWKTASNDAITAVMGEEDLKLGHVLKSDGTYGEYTISLSSNLRGIVFMKDGDSRAYVDGVPAIRISSFEYKALSAGATKDSKNEIWTEGAKKVVNPETYAYYHVNPANASKEQLENLIFALEANGDFITSRAKASDDFAAKPEFVVFKDGILKVKVNVTGTPATDKNITTVALQAQRKNGETVTSDYATIYKTNMDPLYLADIEKINRSTPEDYHYRRGTVGISVKDTEAGAKVKNSLVWSEDAQKKEVVDTVVAYNGQLDLSTFVGVHQKSNTGCSVVKDLTPLGMSIKYEVVKNYKLGTNQTDQKDFVTVTEDGIVTPKVFTTTGQAAIDRTPIVRVSLMNGSNAVQVAYVKIKIVKPSEIKPAKELPLTVDEFKFVCGQDGKSETTVERINVQLYNKLGMSKNEFHKAYPYFTDCTHVKGDVGTVVEKPETDAEGGMTYLYTWKIKNEDLWKHAGEEVSNEIVFKNARTNATDSVVVVLKSKIKGVKKTYNVWKTKGEVPAGENAHYYAEYWNATKEYAKLNVQTPNENETDANKCLFVSDLNAPFYNKNGQLYLDESITNLQYFFCTGKDGVAAIKDINGTKVTFTVSTDGLKLYASAKVGNVTYTNELIATINNVETTGVYDVKRQNSIVLNKESNLAKYLLNTNKLYTFIGAKANVCGETTKEVSITFDGKDHFQANFIRPINITTNANDNFIDGVDFGEKGSFITIEDLISPSDWRIDAKTGKNRLFKDHMTYWDFYGPFDVEALIDEAKCDLNGELQDVPATIVLAQSDATSMGGANSKYGFITYRNNGAGVQNAFNLYIPVKVKYGWGEIVTDPIKVNVATTIQANARKK